MNRRLRTAVAVTAALGAGLLMTACEGDDTSSAPTGARSSATAAPDSSTAPDETSGDGDGKGEGAGAAAGAGKSNGGSGTGTSGSGAKDAGDKSGYGQTCGTNDLSWSVSSESQAGGYFLIKAEAKTGITCVIPAALPVVAFGSDGTEAEPAEQSAGNDITLRAGVAAYAGVNPKTTDEDGGKELSDLIVSVAGDDPNPVSLEVDPFIVDKPIVTSWHTSAADAVPFSS
ncbi:DUF4232 domain-containing protein [Streptomyces sp. NPDC057307]|uniref:DUF4232 domain-containing protein n=1 Tax=Streptomyces sp. NPDC057307 TaxID=3346096 RepID=UPI00363C1E5A